jgi:hypothetical protein
MDESINKIISLMLSLLGNFRNEKINSFIKMLEEFKTKNYKNSLIQLLEDKEEKDNSIIDNLELYYLFIKHNIKEYVQLINIEKLILYLKDHDVNMNYDLLIELSNNDPIILCIISSLLKGLKKDFSPVLSHENLFRISRSISISENIENIEKVNSFTKDKTENKENRIREILNKYSNSSIKILDKSPQMLKFDF